MVQSSDNVPTIGVADALFPSTRQKMLGLFFLHPDKSWTLSEVIRHAEIGSGAVQREVARLAEVGLLQVVPRGRQKEYRANKASPVFEELSALVRKTLGSVELVRSAVASLGDDLDVALIYGSVAKGTDRADSDIDLLLISDTLTMESVFSALMPVEEQVGRKVSPTLYTWEEFRRRLRKQNAFVSKVLEGTYIVLRDTSDGSFETGEPGEDRETQD